MKILAIKQPWASLIVAGLKDVENRTWSTKYRGPLIIHASAKTDDVTDGDINQWYDVFPPVEQPLGCIIGIVDLVDVARTHASKWYQRGQYAFVLENPRPLPLTKWKGIQSLQTPTPALLTQLKL